MHIPTIFDIWLIAAGSTEGKAIIAGILDPGAKTRDASALALPGTLSTVAKFRHNEDQNGAMPEEDKLYWRSQELAKTVSAVFEQYRTDRDEQMAEARKEMLSKKIGKSSEVDEMVDVMMSPLRETEHEFIDGYGDQLRKVVAEECGWLPSEITQYGSTRICCRRSSMRAR